MIFSPTIPFKTALFGLSSASFSTSPVNLSIILGFSGSFVFTLIGLFVFPGYPYVAKLTVIFPSAPGEISLSKEKAVQPHPLLTE